LCTHLHIRTVARRQRRDRSQYVEACSLTQLAYYSSIYARTPLILSPGRTAGRRRCRPCMIHSPIQPRTLQHATAAGPPEERQPPPTPEEHTRRPAAVIGVEAPAGAGIDREACLVRQIWSCQRRAANRQTAAGVAGVRSKPLFYNIRATVAAAVSRPPVRLAVLRASIKGG
jgi:hypothetical protein